MRIARWRAVALGLATTLLGGCAAVPRPPATPQSLLADVPRLNAEHLALRDTIASRLARRSLRRDTLDLLHLSGGGQHGAWGAAFLRGWRARTDAPMPAFDLVSGISTGALQAPFALQGTAGALDTLGRLYRAAADEIAPTFDWWFWLRRTGGLVNTTRYERTIARILDDARVASLGRLADDDRQLLIATTDLDLGIGRAWDLGARLASGGAAVDTVRTLLYTATAIPGIFPPRVLEGHVHGDGGVVANVLAPVDEAMIARIVAMRRAAGRAAPLHVRVWTVMNLWTHVAPRVVPASNRGAISDRTLELLFWITQPQLLRHLETVARLVNARDDGATMALRIAAPPSWLATEPGADALFDRAWMARLDSLGEARARSDAMWDEVVGPYERPRRTTGAVR